MPRTQDQFELALEDVEDLSKREQWIVERLKQYWHLDRDIEEQEKIISGKLSRVSISMSAYRAPEDDESVMAELRTQTMSDERRFIVETVKATVDVSRDRYTNTQRIAKRLQHTKSNAPFADMALQDAYMMLTERETEEYVHLTGPERYAVEREREIAEATDERDMLVRRKQAIEHAMVDLKKYEPEWYDLLWYRYARKETVKKDVYTRRMNMSDQNYRTERKNALKQFDKWAVGLC